MTNGGGLAIACSVNGVNVAFTMDHLKQLQLAALDPRKPCHQYLAVHFINNYLAEVETINPEVVHAFIVPLVRCMGHSSANMLKKEAASALISITAACENYSRMLIDTGALPVFIDLLRSPDEDLRCLVVAVCANIIGRCSENRNVVLKAGIIPPLLSCFGNDMTLNMQRLAPWIMGNICRSKVPQSFVNIKVHFMPTINRLLDVLDIEVLFDAVGALFFIAVGGNEFRDMIVEAGILPKMIQLLCYNHQRLQSIILRTMEMMIMNSIPRIQAVLDCNPLMYFHELLSHEYNGVRKLAAWNILYISEGNPKQIESIVMAGLIPRIVANLNDTKYTVRKVALEIIHNLVLKTKYDFIVPKVMDYIIEPLCGILSDNDNKFKILALETLNQLTYGSYKVPVLDLIRHFGGYDKAHQLQTDKDAPVRYLAWETIDRYYFDDDLASD